MLARIAGQAALPALNWKPTTEENMNIATDETTEVESTVFACDGGSGAFGHPRVYLRLGKDRTSKCPYCGRHFMLKRETAS